MIISIICLVVGVVVGLLIGVHNPTIGAAAAKVAKNADVKIAAGIKKL